MRGLFVAASLAALTAGSAHAFDWSSNSYGHDAEAWWGVVADAGRFCRFSTSVDADGVNGSANAGPFRRLGGAMGGSAAEADGVFELDIQDPSTDTVRGARVDTNFGYSVCNFQFDVEARSDNGGLEYDGTWTTSDPDFVQTIPYSVAFNFGGHSGSAPISTSWTDLASGIEPTAALFRFRLNVRPIRNRLMLQGAYEDFLQVRMSPSV